MYLASEQSCELLQNEEICVPQVVVQVAWCGCCTLQYTWQQRQVTAVTTPGYYTLVTWRCY